MSMPGVQQIAGRVAAEQRAAMVAGLAHGRTPLHVLNVAVGAAARASAAGDASPDCERRACRAGCPACCHMAVSVTAIEALWIADQLAGKAGYSGVNGLRERLAATSARVSHLTIEERAAARVPCALLGPAGECTIHEFRPLGCRGWTSFSRAACERALAAAEPGPSEALDAVALAVASATTEGLEQGARELGLDAGSYELHAAVLRALDTPDAAERWARGEDVFAGCPRVTSERLRA